MRFDCKTFLRGSSDRASNFSQTRMPITRISSIPMEAASGFPPRFSSEGVPLGQTHFFVLYPNPYYKYVVNLIGAAHPVFYEFLQVPALFFHRFVLNT